MSIDVSEDEILRFGKALLEILLYDRTTEQNIIWGTSDYEIYGEDYKAQLPIKIDLITGKNKYIIQPRVCKEKNSQTLRTKDKAEVFTPSWICNLQNNLIDNAWFGRENVFNVQNNKSWISTIDVIKFDTKATRQWVDYVDEKRLEVACGEAPYLVSRYDTVTGEYIKITNRIGLLDRKLRVVNENATNDAEWMTWTIRAFQSVYGFEFQGDSLLLARENLLYTFIDYFRFRFKREPSLKELETIAIIISWNIWQMDGKTFTVPLSTLTDNYQQFYIADLFVESNSEPQFCKIRDWRLDETLTYASLVQYQGGKTIL